MSRNLPGGGGKKSSCFHLENGRYTMVCISSVIRTKTMPRKHVLSVYIYARALIHSFGRADQRRNMERL